MLFQNNPLFGTAPLMKQSGLFSNSPLFSGQLTPEADELISRFSTPPTAARAQLINNLVTSLISAGVWNKLEAFWVPAAADAQAASLNWKSASFTLAPVNSPTFTADRGWQTNGSNNYLTTGLTPSASTLATLNNAHVSTWINVSAPAAGTADIGAQDGTGAVFLRAHESPTTAGFRVHQTGTATVTVVSPGVGFGVAVRTGATTSMYYKDAVSTGTQANSSTAMPAFPLFIGAINISGSPSNFGARRVASASYGSALTQTEITAYYNAVQTYLTAVGGA